MLRSGSARARAGGGVSRAFALYPFYTTLVLFFEAPHPQRRWRHWESCKARCGTHGCAHRWRARLAVGPKPKRIPFFRLGYRCHRVVLHRATCTQRCARPSRRRAQAGRRGGFTTCRRRPAKARACCRAMTARATSTHDAHVRGERSVSVRNQRVDGEGPPRGPSHCLVDVHRGRRWLQRSCVGLQRRAVAGEGVRVECAGRGRGRRMGRRGSRRRGACEGRRDWRTLVREVVRGNVLYRPARQRGGWPCTPCATRAAHPRVRDGRRRQTRARTRRHAARFRRAGRWSG